MKLYFFLLLSHIYGADFPGDPMADPDSIFVIGSSRFTVLTENLIRIEYSVASPPIFENNQTLVVWNRKLPVPHITKYTNGTVTTISTSGFTLYYDSAVLGLSEKNLKVKLKTNRYWINMSDWNPTSSTAGNLFGTWRTWDTLNGPQDMNCTRHHPWITTHEPEHCQFGLISKAGWAGFDDSRSPLLYNRWIHSQSKGQCDVLSSNRKPCFEVQNHNNAHDCIASGCCWDDINTTDPTLIGYNVASLRFGYVYDPSKPQPLGTQTLKIWYNSVQKDHYTTACAIGETEAKAKNFTLIKIIGFVPNSIPLSTSGHLLAAKQLKLFHSITRNDHFSDINNCRGCGNIYTFVRNQGYLFTQDGPGLVPVSLYWSRSALDNAVSTALLSKCFQLSGNIDYYLFTHGIDYHAALKDYTKIAGKIPIPRRHMLGASWSRWGQAGRTQKWDTMNQTETMEAVWGLGNNSFPLDTFIFDMNWHLKTTGWTGYTWDLKWYPDHVGLLQWMHNRGLYTAANLHDAQGVQKQEEYYPQIAKIMGVDQGNTVTFHISNKTYAEALEKVILHPLEKEGLDFWWTDWQQGLGTQDATKTGLGMGTLDITGLNPTIWLNHLRFVNSGGKNLRGQIHSRYGGLGNHRYATGFGGDVRQSWESLQFMVYTTVTASNVAFAWWGQEIMHKGGHFENPELFTRVVQFGAWSPIYNNWGNPNSNDNLWLFPSIYRRGMQRALAHRAMSIPFRYTLARIAHDYGISPLRPMYYAYPWLNEAYNLPNQYMIGDQLIASPIFSKLEPPNNVSKQLVFLPSGHKWIAFASLGEGSTKELPKSYVGGKWFNVSAGIDEVPVWVRAGSVLPMLPYDIAIQHGSAARPITVLEWWVYPGANAGSFWLYEDDGLSNDYLDMDMPGGKAEFANTTFNYKQNSVACTTFEIQTFRKYTGMATGRNMTIRLMEATNMTIKDPTHINVNGHDLPHSSWARQDGNRYLGPNVAIYLGYFANITNLITVVICN